MSQIRTLENCRVSREFTAAPTCFSRPPLSVVALCAWHTCGTAHLRKPPGVVECVDEVSAGVARTAPSCVDRCDPLTAATSPAAPRELPAVPRGDVAARARGVVGQHHTSSERETFDQVIERVRRHCSPVIADEEFRSWTASETAVGSLGRYVSSRTGEWDLAMLLALRSTADV